MKIKLNSFQPSFSFLLFKRESKWRRKNFFSLLQSKKKFSWAKYCIRRRFMCKMDVISPLSSFFPPCALPEWQTNLIRYQITAKHFSWILLLLCCLPKRGEQSREGGEMRYFSFSHENSRELCEMEYKFHSEKYSYNFHFSSHPIVLAPAWQWKLQTQATLSWYNNRKKTFISEGEMRESEKSEKSLSRMIYCDLCFD